MGPLLVGLYVAAQICGVIPLMGCDSVHAFAATHMLSKCEATGGLPQHPHHTGDADDAAHHHVLKDLNGVLAQVPDRGENTVVDVSVHAAAPRALTEADVVLLERPPKPFLSV